MTALAKPDVQARYAAGVKDILQRTFDGEDLKPADIIVKSGKLAPQVRTCSLTGTCWIPGATGHQRILRSRESHHMGALRSMMLRVRVDSRHRKEGIAHSHVYH